MTRISSTWQDTLTLDTEEGYVECPAEFDIEGEKYPAEPYSWGGWRGTEVEVGAELLSARFGGLALTRDMVETITGKAHLERQEDSIAQAFIEAYRMGEAA